MPVFVGLLGALQLVIDGQEVPAGGARERGVLAVLAGCGTSLSADALVDRVWGEDGGSRGSLQVHVHNLRARLGSSAGVLVHSAGGYRLTGPGLTVDTDQVAELTLAASQAGNDGDHALAAALCTQALALFRGDYCADLPDLEVDAERTAFAESRWALLEDRIEAQLRIGGIDLVGELESLVLQQPYRERLWSLLIVSLYAAHRQVDALAAYQRARESLLDGAGLDPGVELRSLERAILAQVDPTDLLRRGGETGPALLWLDGDGQPRRRALPQSGELVIGRLDGADIRFDGDGGVSRRHAAVRRDGLGWQLVDLGSLNGTTLNGEPVGDPVALTTGDRLRCGSTTLLVTAPSSGRRSKGLGAEVLATHRLGGVQA